MNSTFVDQWNWQLQFLPAVEEIIREHARHFLKFELAPPHLDKYEGTDMLLNVTGTGDRWAIRLRTHESTARNGTIYRDFTIRSQGMGITTELDKLRQSECPIQWYFYGWIDRANRLSEYIIVDMLQAWDAGLFQKNRRDIPNGDGTKFIAISRNELRKARALVASCIWHEHYGGHEFFMRPKISNTIVAIKDAVLVTPSNGKMAAEQEGDESTSALPF